MGGLVARAGALLGGGIVVVIMLAVNGGYVYKTTCPMASGGSQTSWTYGINDIVPYIRTTSPPCYSHTGTRLLISAVGIAPLGHHSQPSAADTVRNRVLSTALATTNLAVEHEYATERVHAVKVKALFQIGREVGVAYMLQEFRRNAATYDSFRSRLDAAVDAPDRNLDQAKRLLGQWLALQAKVDRVGVTAIQSDATGATFKAQELAIAREITPITLQLRSLAVTLASSYPQLTHWSYLANQGS